MRLWRRTLPIIMATLWVGLGSHCLLEVLPGLEFLSCCHHAVEQKSPAHHEKDCGNDGCSTIEAGLYQLAKPQLTPSKPLAPMVAWLIPPPGTDNLFAPRSPALAPSSPPELPRTWQFFRRAALPPRAPSSIIS